MAKTDWFQLLGYVTGLVNQELLLNNEYLVAENRILKAHIRGRLLLSDGDKATLAEIANSVLAADDRDCPQAQTQNCPQRVGRKAPAQIARVAKPDTILA